MDFREIIEFNKPSYTKTELKIYDGIIKHLDLIERYTVMQLAAYLKVSHSAVMRFCRKLGYSGYSDFRFSYMKYAHSGTEESTNGMLQAVLALYQDEFKAFSQMDEEAFQTLADLLRAHDRIICAGFGKSSIPGRFLKYNFARLNRYISMDDDTVLINDYEKVFRKEDLVIIFSVGGYSDRITRLVAAAQRAGSDSIMITFNEKSPNLPLVTHKVVLPHAVKKKSSALLCDHIIMSLYVDLVTTYYINHYM